MRSNSPVVSVENDVLIIRNAPGNSLLTALGALHDNTRACWVLHPSAAKELGTAADPDWIFDPVAATKCGRTPPSEPFDYDGTLDGLRGVKLEDLKTLTPKTVERFTSFGIHNVFDLLLTCPRRYLDRSNPTPIGSLRSMQTGSEVGVIGTVKNVRSTTTRTGQSLVRIMIADSTGQLACTWFGAPWQGKRFRTGDNIVAWGKVDMWNEQLQLQSPIMDVLGATATPVVPIYPASAKTRITTWNVLRAVTEATQRIGTLTDPIPNDILERNQLTTRQDALHKVHLPSNLAEANVARRRLAFDELFRMQLALIMGKKDNERNERGVTHTPSGKLTHQFLNTLAFTPTSAQQRAIQEIVADLKNPWPMHRLLQGDVGAGKTLVAVAAALNAIESGHQVAVLAPTELLAEQLHTNITTFTTNLDTPINVALLTNKTRGRTRNTVLEQLTEGTTHIAVGTHALLTQDVTFKSLGLAIIDEQHRFGVEQRAQLRAKGPGCNPDMLVMTATPIPRTAAMTVFGDLDVSILDELPPGRTPITTIWTHDTADPQKAQDWMWNDIRTQISDGHQCYVVCPLVEDSETRAAASAQATLELLANTELAGYRLGLVHGKLKSVDKTRIMNEFRDHDLDVLIATTVIEVGVDVPNATIIVILDAASFGIAQLHQLRGRVGRGKHASTCFLTGEATTSDGAARLQALTNTTDGFRLAEIDLQLRGEGAILGTRQAGQSDLRVASLHDDKDLLEIARREAQQLLDTDPTLARRPGLATETRIVLGEGIEYLFNA